MPSFDIKKKLSFTSLKQFKRKMAAKGFAFSGSGAYGTVMTRGEVAVKVGTLRCNKAYLAWVAQVRELAGHANAPRINSVTVYKSPIPFVFDSFFVVEMEKLSVRPPGDYATAMRWYDNLKRFVLQMRKNGYISTHKEYVNPATRAIASAIAKASKGHRIDMHPGNVMFRGHTPVITDPVA